MPNHLESNFTTPGGPWVRNASLGFFMSDDGLPIRRSKTADGNGFVLQIIDEQPRLYSYILSLVLDRERARDILQQTNLVLLEKEADFSPGTNFRAWACRIAYFEVLAERRERNRDRHLFSEELLALIAVNAGSGISRAEDRQAALRQCLAKLAPEQRELVSARYRPGGSVARMAESMHKTPGAISAALHRIRVALASCIENRLKEAAAP